MARGKRGVTSHAKHKKVLDQAKAYNGRRKNTSRIAKQAVEKANLDAYRDRKTRTRNFRALWIQRINAAARSLGFTYARLIDGLSRAGIEDVSIEPTRVYKVEDAREFLSGHGFDVDAIAPLVDGRFFSGFIRAQKPVAVPQPA